MSDWKTLFEKFEGTGELTSKEVRYLFAVLQVDEKLIQQQKLRIKLLESKFTPINVRGS